MKTIFTIIFLLVMNYAKGQVKYFQRHFNINIQVPTRTERFNSGILTKENYAGGNGAKYYYVGIGTSYYSPPLLPILNADYFRFTRLTHTGAVEDNLGHQFSGSDGKAFHSRGKSIAEISNANGTGGYLAVGTVISNASTGAIAAGDGDMLLTKLDDAGQPDNAATYRIDIGGRDIPWCIKSSRILVDNEPTWLICGTSRFGDRADCFVARVKADGTQVWCYRYNLDPLSPLGLIAANCRARQLCEGDDGKIYVVGLVEDSPVGAHGTDGLAFALKDDGNLEWAHRYHLASKDEFQAVRLTTDGNLIVGGSTNDGGTDNMQIVRLAAATGDIQWAHILRASTGGVTYPSKCYDIVASPADQNYFLAGYLTRNGNKIQMIYKTEADGTADTWNSFNPMQYSLGFALDKRGEGQAFKGTPSCPPLAYFSSIKNPADPAISDSHIMKLDFLIKTCNFMEPTPGNSIESPIKKYNVNSMRWTAGTWHKLTCSRTIDFDDNLICAEACPEGA